VKPRPYQIEAIDALNNWLPRNDGNPCIVLPTGAGKTPTMAWIIQQYVTAWPETRIIVLAHVKELLEQGVSKMRAIWPMAPIGVYSAGLRSRDMHYNITYAGIQSVRNRACDFEPFDLIFVDEAHRIPLDGEGSYRKFLSDVKLVNPRVRVVGWTATPYRLAGGPICGPNNILNEVVYEANVRDLIEQGYLSKLKSKGGDAAVDASGVHIRKGEFVTSELEALVDDKVSAAVAEAAGMLDGRRSVLTFCVSVAHAERVAAEFGRHGIHAETIDADTDSRTRADVIDRFQKQRLRMICNVNVLSEGFDAQQVDAVVMLRPSASAGLYYQQVGRGFRIHPNKTDCLVLDFAGNIERHGPVDAIKIKGKPLGDGTGEPVVKKCPNCKELVPAGVRECPECGYEFPKPELKHNTKAANTPVLTTSDPWAVDVRKVEVTRHQKAGKPPVLRVTYFSDYESHSEWICLEHGGFAQHKAGKWWTRRFGNPIPATVDDALSDPLLGWKIQQMTSEVTVRQVGKYTEVVTTHIKDEHHAIIA
jgi:DNA repair protein RadD